MFVIRQAELRALDLSQASEFIEYWRQFYTDNVKVYGSQEQINYGKELNVGHDLTPQNLKRLLRWKDPQFLTEEIHGGTADAHLNPKVQKVLSELPSINAFRCNKLPDSEYRGVVSNLFPNGVVWRAFLFHLARPAEYPIADRFVFRAARSWLGAEKPKSGETWSDYDKYRSLFVQICQAAGRLQSEPSLEDSHDLTPVLRLKTVDDALMSFGRFLETFDPE